MRSQGLRERARVVVSRSNGVRDDMGHRRGVFSLAEQVRRDPGRASHRRAGQDTPLGIRQSPDVEANVGSAGLPSARKDEVVAVGRQVAEAVESCGRTVRDNGLFRAALPAWGVRGELKPCSAKLLVSWRGRANR